MTDIVLNAGAGGATIAADDASAISAAGIVQYQIIKLAFGPAQTRTLVQDSAGARFPVASFLQAGAANIGFINSISATVNTVIGAGAANIGTINDISRTVSVVLGAGAANVGSINNISATVAVVVGASANNIGFINSISATVNTVIGAGTANIGSINGISATVIALIRNWDSGNLIPITGTVSTTAGTAVLGAPGAGSALHVASVMCSNKSAALTRVKLRTNSAGSTVRVMGDAASGGGGFVWKPSRVWRLTANKGLLISCSPAVSDVAFTIENFTAT